MQLGSFWQIGQFVRVSGDCSAGAGFWCGSWFGVLFCFLIDLWKSAKKALFADCIVTSLIKNGANRAFFADFPKSIKTWKIEKLKN
jgi:hypothetical protein